MDSDLIAWVLAITLGVAVVGLGLRCNLSDLTQDWLPRYREVSEAIGAVVFMLRSPSSSGA